MLGFIALGLFVIGASCLSYLLIKRGSLLDEVEGSEWEWLVVLKSYWKKAIKRVGVFLKKMVEGLSWSMMVQKVLSRVRVWILKIDKTVASYLSQIREHSKKQKEREDYWKKVSGSVNDPDQPA